jgi:aminoglycoside phosphotransferase (APT) family kinase protein
MSAPDLAASAPALGAWLAAHVEGFRGPFTTSRFKGGQSNPTFAIDAASGRYVLRSKPVGALLPGAHAIEREHAVLAALHPTGFPVARPFALCEDAGVTGAPFYVMERVEGRIFWDARLPDLAPAERRAAFDSMNMTIARLHSLDPAAIGLADYGKPGNYFARQISRWSKQYLADAAAGRDASMDRLVEWLPATIPPGDETAIVHGDFRIDNMIFDATQPRVIAVLDWELSTLGHPLADFAYHLLMYRMPRDLHIGFGGEDPAALGLPSEADYTAAYAARTGRAGPLRLDWHMAFNLFRFAAIIHGIRGRVIRGTAASPQAREASDRFEAVAALAWEQAQRAMEDR